MNIDITLDCFAASDKGLRRRLNEDSYLSNPDLGLFLVADGMGGESCGDVASRLTARTFQSSITPYLTDEEATIPFEHNSEGDFILHAMAHAADQTNEVVMQTVKENPTCKGMGSTLTAAMVSDGMIYIVHVGDSRFYQYEDGIITPVTEDHTRVQEWVRKNVISAEEARTHRDRHVITRCVGRKKQFKPDLFKRGLNPESVYLICSDGLYDMVDDQIIAETISENENLEFIGEKLVALANQAGGKDNITLILFRAGTEPYLEEQV